MRHGNSVFNKDTETSVDAGREVGLDSSAEQREATTFRKVHLSTMIQLLSSGVGAKRNVVTNEEKIANIKRAGSWPTFRVT
jgi:hypothetical protein